MSKEYIKYFSSSSDMENFYVIDVPFSAYNDEQQAGYFSTRPGILNTDGTISNSRMITYTTSDNKKLSVIDSKFSDISFHEYNDCGVVIFNSDFISGLQNISLGSTLTSINLPDGVWIINNAFTDTRITEIHIPKKCNTITNLFSGSDTLKVITVDKENQCFVANDNVLFSKNMDTLKRYAPGKPQTSYIISPTVVSIEYHAFDFCKSLKSVSIPDSVKSIGNRAFSDCSSLISITIPDSVTSIGGHAFSNCSSLTSPVYNAHIFAYLPTSYSGTYAIPDGIESIAGGAFSDCSSLTSITIPNSITTIGDSAFQGCSGLTSITIPNSVTSIGNNAFRECRSLTSIVIPDSVTSIAGYFIFYNCTSLQTVYLQPTSVITIADNADLLQNAQTILVPHNLLDSYKRTYSDYVSKFKSDYTPQTCTSLQITADDVVGNSTTTTIHWTAITNGIDYAGNLIEGVVVSGESVSDSFEQNTSNESITKTITFTYLGMTAESTFVHQPWENHYYTVDTNNQWRLSTNVPNPDSQQYEGVYESNSNKGVDNTAATMYIDIIGYENFTVYIRSYGESNYDYVMISQPDASITNSTSYSSTNVKQHTYGKSNSGTSIGSYQVVSYTGLGGTSHRLTVVYRKDGSQSNGDDRGYILIPKNQ